MAWPMVLTSGGPRERGRAHGTQARSRVQGSIALYERVFAHYTALRWNEVRDRAGRFVEPIDAYDPRMLPELEGIAEGAGVDAEDVLALNVRTEVMFGFDRRAAHAAAKECTAIAASPGATEDAHVLIAQNWDWKQGARETVILLVAAPHDRPGLVTVVEAGLLAKCGVNEAGIGLATNALQSSRDRGEPGAPYHAICRGILSAATFEEAAAAVERVPRASSANYLIASRTGSITDLETAPGGPDTVHRLHGETLAHTNHFLWGRRPFKDLGRIDGKDSLDRQAVAERVAPTRGGRTTREAIAAALRSHGPGEGWVCAHGDPSLAPEEDYVTVASMSADLTEGTLRVTEGNPCTAVEDAYDVATLIGAARAG